MYFHHRVPLRTILPRDLSSSAVNFAFSKEPTRRVRRRPSERHEYPVWVSQRHDQRPTFGFDFAAAAGFATGIVVACKPAGAFPIRDAAAQFLPSVCNTTVAGDFGNRRPPPIQTAVASGANTDAVLGQGDTMNSLTPRPIKAISAGAHFAQVECGPFHTLALTKLGDVWAWGFNGNGRLGLADAGPQTGEQSEKSRTPNLKLGRSADVRCAWAVGLILRDLRKSLSQACVAVAVSAMKGTPGKKERNWPSLR